MGRFRGRLGRHHGFALGKCDDGSLVDLPDTTGSDVSAYVAVCAEASRGVHWYGVTEYPPTEQGEKAAVDEWEILHARQLSTAVADGGVAGEIAAILHRLDSLAIESPVAMLAELSRVQQRSVELIELVVRHARQAGMSWAVIASQLGLSEAVVRQRYSDI